MPRRSHILTALSVITVAAMLLPAGATSAPKHDKTVPACSNAAPPAQPILGARNKHCAVPLPAVLSAFSSAANEVTITGENLDRAAAIELADDQGMSMGSGWNPAHPNSSEVAQPGSPWFVEVRQWTPEQVILRKATTGGYGAWGTLVVTLIRTNDWDLAQHRDFAAPDAFDSFTVQRPAGQVFVRRAYSPAARQLLIEGIGLLDLNWMQARRGTMSHIGDSWAFPGVDASQQHRAFKNYLGDPKLVLLTHPYLSGASVDNVLLGTFTGLAGGTQPFVLQPAVYVP